MRTSFPVAAATASWAAIADPEKLAAALPGCRSVTRGAAGGDGTLHVVAEVAVASVRGVWAGTVAPLDADAVRVRGAGAPGTVDLVVRADPQRTSLTVEGTVEGALGTVGSAVLAAAVRRTAQDLLAALAAPGVAGVADLPAAPAGPGVGPAAGVGAVAVPVGRRRRRLRVVAGAAALAAAAVLGRRLVGRKAP